MQVVVEMMRFGGNGRTFPWRLNEPLHFTRTALVHSNQFRTRGNGACQKEVPPHASITNALRDSSQESFQRRTRRVGKDEGSLKTFFPYPPSNLENAFIRAKCHHRVQGRMILPKVG